MSAARRKRQSNRTEVKTDGHFARRPSPRTTPTVPTDAPLAIAKAAFSGRALWISLFLIAANLVVYAPVVSHDFVNFDDPLYVSRNAQVSRGLTWQGVQWAFTTGHAANWHPLTWLAHMLDAQLFGMNAGAHHLPNVLLHIINTLLLFGLLHSMTGALGRSAVVAALFALHPLHVESVAWVSERKDVLSATFLMLTLCAYLRYVRQPRLSRYLVMLLFFALGLMAKPMLVTLPFVLLLLDVWPLGRLAQGSDPLGRLGSASLWNQRPVVLRLVWEKLPLLALAIASSIVTFVVQQRGGSVTGLDSLPLILRLENAAVSYIAYIGKMLWPARLAAFYPYSRSLPAWEVGVSILLLMGVFVTAIRVARSLPYIAVGSLWYAGTMVPVIGLVQVGNQAMADHYTYVPLIGLFLAVTWGVSDLLRRWPNRRIGLAAAAGILAAACVISARIQVGYWKNDIALWSHALVVSPGNYFAHHNLGAALADEGKMSEAIAHYSEALRAKPNFALGHYNLGNALASQGRIEDAIGHYSEALRIQPAFSDAHNNLGNVLVRQGKVEEAVAHYSEALRIQPALSDAHNNLGNILARQGKVEEAMAHYSEALRINPGHANAHNNLGLALVKQGKVEEAIAHYSEALRINPHYSNAHYNLGVALKNLGKLDEARAHFSRALVIDPQNTSAQRALEDLKAPAAHTSAPGAQ